MKIVFVLGSIRDGRAGQKVWDWLKKEMASRSDVETEFVDLKEENLPWLTSNMMPGGITNGDYGDPTVNAWSKKISSADAYIIVTPEYNHGYPGVLKNALDLLYNEWNNKPVGFVSYGGAASGARSVEQLRLVAIELSLVPIEYSVHIPLGLKPFDESGAPANPNLKKSFDRMLEKLLSWAIIFKNARTT